MAMQTINVGAAANDGTGDALRVAFQKVNSNTDELYVSTDALATSLSSKLDTSAVDTDAAMAANSDSRVPSQKAAKTAIDAKLNASAVDPDSTFAANSDEKVPSQKAVKTAIDAITGGWATWTPTITAESGTLTSYTITNARYKRIGKSITFSVTFQITDNGTAAGAFFVTLPVLAGFRASPVGNNVSAGKLLSVGLAGGSMSMYAYDGTHPAETGQTLNVTGIYEAA